MTDCPSCQARRSVDADGYCTCCGKVQGRRPNAAGEPTIPTSDGARPSPLKLVWLPALLIALGAGCADRGYRPEVFAPTRAQLAALLAAPVVHATPITEAPFSLTVYPRAAQPGQAVWVTCHVPQSKGPGRIAFGIPGVNFSADGPLDRIEHRRLVEHLPCGTLTVVCAIQTVTGKDYLEQPLEVTGGLCDGH